MALNSFHPFPRLVTELETEIWRLAIDDQIQDVVSNLPRWCASPRNDRRRQALGGSGRANYEDPLHIHIRHFYPGPKLRFEDDEFETFVDSFPISAVCHDSRRELAATCRPMIPHVYLKYDRWPLNSLEPNEVNGMPDVLRDGYCHPLAHGLEHLYPCPTVLTVAGANSFASAENLVALVTRFFGDRIERLTLKSLAYARGDEYDALYWGRHNTPVTIKVHPSQDSGHADPLVVVVAADQEENYPDNFWTAISDDREISAEDWAGRNTIHVTRNHELHVSRHFWHKEELSEHDGYTEITAKGRTEHLLRLYEIFNAASERLPLLKHIEMNMEIQCWGTEHERIETNWRRV